MRRIKALLGFVMAGVLAGGLLVGWSRATAAVSEDVTPPKISTFASADDLAAELKFMIADLEKAVVSEDEFNGQVEDRFSRDGNTIALIAIALGLHDQDGPLKPHAKVIAAAARKLADAKDFAATKQAVEELQADVAGKGAAAGDLKWAKVATLDGLMKREVPHIDKKLKDSLHHFKKRSAEVAANAATMALIAENARLYLDDTSLPGEGKQWTAFTGRMRAAAVDLAAKAHAGDEAGANAAMETLNQSCHACHAVFNPEKK